MWRQVNAGLQDWVSKRLAENGQRPVSSPAPRSKPWWQQGWEWVREKIERFVMQPPSWLSISYPLQEFSVGNYTAAQWISYQPSASNWRETFVYQKVQAELKEETRLTTNPDGIVDLNLGNGAITFQGKNSSFFVQPSALSFGWESKFDSPLPSQQEGPNVRSISRTVVDFDLLGENLLSLKVSHAAGTETFKRFQILMVQRSKRWLKPTWMSL